MSGRDLVTGATGFAGGFLVDHLLSLGRQVAGTVYGDVPPDHPAGRIPLYPCDLRDADETRETVARAAPDRVYHAAAQADVARAWKEPAETFRVNAMGTVNLLEACRSLGTEARILLISSATVYGPPPEGRPLTEDLPLRPADPYGVSKAAADQAAVLYHKAFGMDVVRARAFNHIGPGAAAKYALGGFARQIAELEPEGGGDLRVGNLSARRNLTDVRDVVRAYALLMERAESGEAYNVCGDTVVTIEEVLDRLIDLSPGAFRKVPDPERLRPIDAPVIDGDNSRLKRATGWAPEIPLEQSLSDLLAYWRERVGRTPRRTA
ncbi:MAG: GDP-mannose 4,6-dehydratase [Nitrospinota bacterium]